MTGDSSKVPVQGTGSYLPSPFQMARDQVAVYEASEGTRGNTLRDTGIPVIILTTRGAQTGAVRKSPLVRVMHGGAYALIGSYGGGPRDPAWCHNLRANPTDVAVQDGPAPFAATVREVVGAERDEWVTRAIAVYAAFADYVAGDRFIPVFVAAPRISTTGR
jgi:F420H(2)-dependent quinone reductase